jgi:UDP-2,3-diacylglucosamine pyrophosphatase LpxH
MRFRKWLGISFKSLMKKATCTNLEGQEYTGIVGQIHSEARRYYSLVENYDVLVMGHTHMPTDVPRGDLLARFINAGDWKWNNTYVEMDDQSIRLRRFMEDGSSRTFALTGALRHPWAK